MEHNCLECGKDISQMAKQARRCKECRQQRDHKYHVAYNKEYNKRPENLHYGRKVSKNFRKNHPDRIKEKHHLHSKRYKYNYNTKLKLDVFEAYSDDPSHIKCVKCGYDDIRALQLDHIDGSGAKQRKELGRTSVFPWIRQNDYPEGYQILCANCNWIKRHENKEN